MKNLLLSAAIGDIAGSAYESRYNSTKNYDAVEMFASHARFTDDTVCTLLVPKPCWTISTWPIICGSVPTGIRMQATATGSGFGWLHLSIILMAATATAAL